MSDDALRVAVRFATPELKNRFEAENENMGIDGDPAQLALVEAGLAKFAKPVDGGMLVTIDAFERFDKVRTEYDARLQQGLDKVARTEGQAHPFRYALHYVVGNLANGIIGQGQEFRRREANFGYEELSSVIDAGEKKVP
jgi:hypothetical protein